MRKYYVKYLILPVNFELRNKLCGILENYITGVSEQNKSKAEYTRCFNAEKFSFLTANFSEIWKNKLKL